MNTHHTYDHAQSDCQFTHYMALVTETWPPEINGVAMTLQRLIHGMLAKGWQVQVVRPRQKSDGRKSDVHIEPQHGIRHVLVPGLPIPGYKGLRFGMPMLAKLREQWKKNRPDVVHIATEGPLGWAALKVAKNLDIPVTSSFHTNFHSYCNYYRMGWLRGMVMRHLRVFHNQSSLTMVPNAILRDMLLEENYRNVVVLGRGVDSGLFSAHRRSAALRAAWGVEEDGLAVIYVGRMAAEKSLHVVVKAFTAIQQNNPKARMVWVGDGPALKKLLKQHPDHIFCGARLGESLAEHYASGDLFLFPSMTETFGNVVTEAMASGLAVVAYDYAAAEIFIKHQQNGLIVPFGDQAAFIQAAIDIVKDMPQLKKLGQSAHLAVADYSWDKIFSHFDSYLKHAVVQKSAIESVELIAEEV